MAKRNTTPTLPIGSRDLLNQHDVVTVNISKKQYAMLQEASSWEPTLSERVYVNRNEAATTESHLFGVITTLEDYSADFEGGELRAANTLLGKFRKLYLLPEEIEVQESLLAILATPTMVRMLTLASKLSDAKPVDAEWDEAMATRIIKGRKSLALRDLNRIGDIITTLEALLSFNVSKKPVTTLIERLQALKVKADAIAEKKQPVFTAEKVIAYGVLDFGQALNDDVSRHTRLTQGEQGFVIRTEDVLKREIDDIATRLTILEEERDNLDDEDEEECYASLEDQIDEVQAILDLLETAYDCFEEGETRCPVIGFTDDNDVDVLRYMNETATVTKVKSAPLVAAVTYPPQAEIDAIEEVDVTEEITEEDLKDAEEPRGMSMEDLAAEADLLLEQAIAEDDGKPLNAVAPANGFMDLAKMNAVTPEIDEATRTKNAFDAAVAKYKASQASAAPEPAPEPEQEDKRLMPTMDFIYSLEVPGMMQTLGVKDLGKGKFSVATPCIVKEVREQYSATFPKSKGITVGKDKVTFTYPACLAEFPEFRDLVVHGTTKVLDDNGEETDNVIRHAEVHSIVVEKFEEFVTVCMIKAPRTGWHNIPLTPFSERKGKAAQYAALAVDHTLSRDARSPIICRSSGFVALHHDHLTAPGFADALLEQFNDMKEYVTDTAAFMKPLTKFNTLINWYADDEEDEDEIEETATEGDLTIDVTAVIAYLGRSIFDHIDGVNVIDTEASFANADAIDEAVQVIYASRAGLDLDPDEDERLDRIVEEMESYI